MGIGWTEIVLVLIIALVVLGPAKFPAAARRLGQIYREIRDAVGTVEREVTRAADDEPFAGQPKKPDSVAGSETQTPSDHIAGEEPASGTARPDEDRAR